MKNCKTVVFTDCSNNYFDLLLKEIRKYPVLTKEEEYALWERMQQGSKAARERLINCNLRFVVSKAKEYLWSGMSIDDLFQAGSLGLTLATDKFDAALDNKLISYAVSYIECELLKAVKDHTRNAQYVSLLDPASTDEDCKLVVLDVLDSGAQNYADWDSRYASAFAAMKEQVKHGFFDGAADLWEDYLLMRELGYTLTDVARKHHISVERLKDLIKSINNMLRGSKNSIA